MIICAPCIVGVTCKAMDEYNTVSRSVQYLYDRSSRSRGSSRSKRQRGRSLLDNGIRRGRDLSHPIRVLVEFFGDGVALPVVSILFEAKQQEVRYPAHHHRKESRYWSSRLLVFAPHNRFFFPERWRERSYGKSATARSSTCTSCCLEVLVVQKETDSGVGVKRVRLCRRPFQRTCHHTAPRRPDPRLTLWSNA